MVDLAKIRKKAKKILGVPESSSLPVVEPPSEPPPAPPSVSTTGRLEDSKTSKLERFKEQAGKRRETVKTEQVEHVAGTQLELLTFLIASEHYAVDIERIVEIVTPRPVTRIPNADSSVVGIFPCAARSSRSSTSAASFVTPRGAPLPTRASSSSTSATRPSASSSTACSASSRSPRRRSSRTRSCTPRSSRRRSAASSAPRAR